MRYQIKKQFQDEKFIEAVASRVYSSTGDVARYVGCSPQLANKRLHSLACDGQIKRTRLGNGWMYYI